MNEGIKQGVLIMGLIILLGMFGIHIYKNIEAYKKTHVVAMCDKYKLFLFSQTLVSPNGTVNCTRINTSTEDNYFCPLDTKDKIVDYLLYDNSNKTSFIAVGVPDSLLKESFLESIFSFFTGTPKEKIVNACTKNDGNIEENLLPGYVLCVINKSIPCKVGVEKPSISDIVNIVKY